MSGLFTTICRAALATVLAAALAACSTAQYDCNRKGATLVIVGESGGQGSVAAQGQSFKRVAATLAANLTGHGYQVRDSAQLYAAYPEYFDRDNIAHDDKSLVDLVRSAKGTAVDAIVVMSVAASTEEKDYHTRVQAALDVRLIDVKSGSSLGKFAIDSTEAASVRPACTGSCLAQAVVDNAKPLTVEVAKVVAEKLVCGGSSGGNFDDSRGGFATAYTIIVEGFSSAETMAMENYLEDFSGYESHRVIYAGARRTEWWYETSIKSAALNRNLNTLLQRLNLRGVVQFSGNTYTVKKITLRGGAQKSTSINTEGEDW